MLDVVGIEQQHRPCWLLSILPTGSTTTPGSDRSPVAPLGSSLHVSWLRPQ